MSISIRQFFNKLLPKKLQKLIAKQPIPPNVFHDPGDDSAYNWRYPASQIDHKVYETSNSKDNSEQLKQTDFPQAEEIISIKTENRETNKQSDIAVKTIGKDYDNSIGINNSLAKNYNSTLIKPVDKKTSEPPLCTSLEKETYNKIIQKYEDDIKPGNKINDFWKQYKRNITKDSKLTNHAKNIKGR